MTTNAARSMQDSSDDKLSAFLDAAKKRRSRLMRMAWRLTSGNEEVEDIVQEALLRAFKAQPRFRGDSRMETWLNSIVRNMALVYLRNRKGRIEPPLEPFGVETRARLCTSFLTPARVLKATLSAEQGRMCCDPA